MVLGLCKRGCVGVGHVAACALTLAKVFFAAGGVHKRGLHGAVPLPSLTTSFAAGVSLAGCPVGAAL
jgi:hypothetical protein